MVVESHDDFPRVEISIAGGVGEMVRANYCDHFFFSFFFFFFSFLNLAYLLFLSGQNAQLCSSHGVRYKGPQLERKPCGPKPPTTVLPAIPKLKPSDPARQRNNPPPGTMDRNYKEMRTRA